MASAFDTLLDAFKAQLSATTPVCAFIETDSDTDPLPAGRAASILIELGSATPQGLGGLAGNPVDWSTDVLVKCFASVNATSARPAANTLAAAAYARLAAAPALGINAASGVYIGEPRIEFDAEKAATRMAVTTLIYSVSHRTTNLTLD
jgi:hypothetical protein